MQESDDGDNGVALVGLSLHVNGVEHTVRCGPDDALLDVLRNDLGMVGARFGCGIGLCGACTVLVDGRPTQSCSISAWAVGSRPVTTVEGLGGDDLHPLQQAFIDHRAFQCGYCSSGVTVAAAALLDAEPGADDATVRAALDGNLCRCGAHLRILAAIRSLQGTLR